MCGQQRRVSAHLQEHDRIVRLCLSKRIHFAFGQTFVQRRYVIHNAHFVAIQSAFDVFAVASATTTAMTMMTITMMMMITFIDTTQVRARITCDDRPENLPRPTIPTNIRTKKSVPGSSPPFRVNAYAYNFPSSSSKCIKSARTTPYRSTTASPIRTLRSASFVAPKCRTSSCRPPIRFTCSSDRTGRCRKKASKPSTYQVSEFGSVWAHGHL